jgi:hypothetical protein
MKQLTTKIGAVLMTLIVLLSTMSFTINQRYCDGDLVDTTLFLKSDSCKIVVKSDCCEITEECCDHEQIIIDGQKELPSRIVVETPIVNQYFVINSVKLHLEKYDFQSENRIFYKKYIPPSLVFNKQIVHQVFII